MLCTLSPSAQMLPERMRQRPYLMSTAHWSAHLNDVQTQDYTLNILHDPFQRIHMDITTKNMTKHHNINHETQDKLTLKNQQRATRAIAEDHFANQIVPIKLKTHKNMQLFKINEHIHDEISLKQLTTIKTTFKQDGTMTTNNTSNLNNDTTALLLTNGTTMKNDNLRPIIVTGKQIGRAHV